MPGAGLEPARSCPQGILSPQCLPFHHLGRLCVQNIANLSRIVYMITEFNMVFITFSLGKAFSVYECLLCDCFYIYFKLG